MKINIEYPVQKIIRQNLIYIVTLVVVIVLFVGGVLFFMNQYQENKTSIEKLNGELKDLKKRKELVDFKNETIKDNTDLEKINGILTQLIPVEEDYFSIMASLEKLSLQTGFLIAGYTINVAGSQDGKLSIDVEGLGESSAFLEFLKNYNFGGGRLITIENIDFNQTSFQGSKITLNVFSGKANTGEPIKGLSAEDKRLMETVIQKVQIELTPDEVTSLEYPTKTNPF